MLGFILDAVLLNVAVYLTDSDEAGEFIKNLLICVGIAVANFVVTIGVLIVVAPILGGVMAYLVALAACGLVAGAIIMWAFSFTMNQTIKATAIYFGPTLLLELLVFADWAQLKEMGS